MNCRIGLSFAASYSPKADCYYVASVVASFVSSVPVIAVAGHDTASAVAAVPAANKNFAYLSSGTWSLMGIETDSPVVNDKTTHNNITNE